MVFSSALFLVLFLPIFLVGYYLLPQRLRNLWLMAASLFFYAWGAPIFVYIVLASILIDYFLVGKMAEADGKTKKWFIAGSLVLNIGLLAYFKYANFFIDNVNSILRDLGAGQVAWTRIALPIGISFFTFQKITYTVDVYRNVHKPLKRLTDYAMYILMFPHLIAGPIVRFNLVADQIEDRRYNETAGKPPDRIFQVYHRPVEKSTDRQCTRRMKPTRSLPWMPATCGSGTGMDRHHGLCFPDLFRLFRLFRHGHRAGPDDRLQLPGKLQQSIYLTEHN